MQEKLENSHVGLNMGAIDDSIIEKLWDEEDVRVHLAGADELNCAVKKSNLS